MHKSPHLLWEGVKAESRVQRNVAMKGSWNSRWNRSTFLQLGSPVLASLVLLGGAKRRSRSSASTLSLDHSQAQLPPTPACDSDNPTPPNFEGPFFIPDSPERTSLLETDTTGMRLLLTGQVLSSSCQAIANALVDFWQTDSEGEYDNEGYTLRGHQFTDAEGRYSLETVLPGLYPGRTRHIHVKVQAVDRTILTTQLYFPGESLNEGDRLFQPELLVALQEEGDRLRASFDFVLAG